ncbi:unnamed protein product [Parascedosporium putredinis]|uniref:Uncharacterized protein n=1 Tax=Parascedosporium putredinis TaxID=1442378 RepID=A0A9P1H0Q3_9PEZI|nr:unnamed protein product [Parascedosporium putredinis]CAI7994178.1 unnamed protein product [Parascedosporium putredinis]
MYRLSPSTRVPGFGTSQPRGSRNEPQPRCRTVTSPTASSLYIAIPVPHALRMDKGRSKDALALQFASAPPLPVPNPPALVPLQLELQRPGGPDYSPPRTCPVAVTAESSSEEGQRVCPELRSVWPARLKPLQGGKAWQVRDEPLGLRRSFRKGEGEGQTPPRRRRPTHRRLAPGGRMVRPGRQRALLFLFPAPALEIQLRRHVGSRARLPYAVPGRGRLRDGPGFHVPHQKSGRAVSTSYVLDSEYIGKGVGSDIQSARLTVMTAPQAHVHPLFRWMHFTSPTMDFDAFQDEISRVSGLVSAERKALTKLMTEIRQSYVKPIQISNSKTVRHMEPTFIQDLIPAATSSVSAGKESTARPRPITWICLPYFSLEKYSGLESGASFPVQTLLQAQFSRADKKRDMQQAVVRAKLAGEGECFHIAQVWCVVLDNTFLFTCARHPETTLFGQTIERIVKPLDELGPAMTKEVKSSMAFILVRFANAVVWKFPLEESQTWVAFISHFRELLPTPLIFHHEKTRVTAKEWPALVQRATKIKLVLDLSVDTCPPKQAPSGVLPPVPHHYQQEATKTETPSPAPAPATASEEVVVTLPDPNRPFAIFSFLEGVYSAKTGALDQPNLVKQMTAISDFLHTQTGFSDRKSYRRCAGSSYYEVHKAMELRGAALSSASDNAEKKTQTAEYEEQIDVVSAGLEVFSAFMPHLKGVPTASRFWGAIHRIVDPPASASSYETRPTIRLRDLRVYLRRMSMTLAGFKNLFVNATRKDLARVTVPEDMVLAWIHLLMGIIYLPNDPFRAEHFFSIAEGLIEDGLGKMTMALSDTALSDKSVILPMEVFSLVALGLIRNNNPSLASVSVTYSQYLSFLDSEMKSTRPNRAHERRLAMLRQETTLVLKTLSKQEYIFNKLDRASERLRTAPAAALRSEMDLANAQPAARPRSRAPRGAGPDAVVPALVVRAVGGFRELLARECVEQALRWSRHVSETVAQAIDLEESLRNQIDANKDRQEQAIFAFTIVTVIFLPISAVSSIFGMNTSDVRDMEQSQWLYWVVALPVTAFVFVAAMGMTGDLSRLARWFMSLGSDSEGHHQGACCRRRRGRGKRRLGGI